MAEARSREAWNHTASVMALVANVNRDPKSRPVQPAAFHPFLQPRSRPMSMRELKEMTGGR